MAVTSDGTPYVEPGDAISAYPVVSQELAAVIDSLRLLMPVGTIAPYAGKVTAGAPEGWLPCDGRAYARADFNDLYTVMTEWLPQWGGWPSGNQSRFYVPDLRGRSPIGTASSFNSDGPVRDVNLGVREGDWRPQTHRHAFALPAAANGGAQANPGQHFGAGYTNDSPTSTHAGGLLTEGLADLVPEGAGMNYHPMCGVEFIVYTGTTTTGKNSTGEQLPAVTTRMMIEARLEEAGITDEEREQLRAQLAALKEDTDG